MSDDTFLNYSYGSNMLSARLVARVPSARAVCVGQLGAHILRWHKQSRDGSGKCDAQATGSALDTVWGVLFRINRSEKEKLDNAEGLHQGYEERTVEIVTNDGRVTALMYYATATDSSLRPYDWYKAMVVAGAYEQGLPDHYIGDLEAVNSVNDPDKERNHANTKLCQSALWKMVYQTIRPKVSDKSPNACLNRLAKELLQDAYSPVNESTATVRFQNWTASQLGLLEPKHKRVNQLEDDRPIVVVQHKNKNVLVDGNHRVAKWITMKSQRKHRVLVVHLNG